MRAAAERLAIDTSVAVPLLVGRHPDHRRLLEWAAELDLVLAGHAEAETYSVLTRMREPFRVEADTALRSIRSGLTAVHPPAPQDVVDRVAAHGISGGAVYDALVAIAAADHDLTLATRDARALPTYARIGVRVVLVP